MKNNITICLMLTFLVSTAAFSQNNNTLTSKEKNNGWELLFDGKSFDGWRQCNGDAMPVNWEIEDESMKVFLGEGKKEGQGSRGDILYAPKKYKNFELSIDWKAGPKANSGIFYYVQEVEGKPIYFAAPEVQVLDNEKLLSEATLLDKSCALIAKMHRSGLMQVDIQGNSIGSIHSKKPVNLRHGKTVCQNSKIEPDYPVHVTG